MEVDERRHTICVGDEHEIDKATMIFTYVHIDRAPNVRTDATHRDVTPQREGNAVSARARSHKRTHEHAGTQAGTRARVHICKGSCNGDGFF